MASVMVESKYPGGCTRVYGGHLWGQPRAEAAYLVNQTTEIPLFIGVTKVNHVLGRRPLSGRCEYLSGRLPAT